MQRLWLVWATLLLREQCRLLERINIAAEYEVRCRDNGVTWQTPYVRMIDGAWENRATEWARLRQRGVRLFMDMQRQIDFCLNKLKQSA